MTTEPEVAITAAHESDDEGAREPTRDRGAPDGATSATPRLDLRRLALLVVVVLALVLAGRHLVRAHGLDVAALQRAARAWGKWSALAFVGAFGLGVTLHVPGLIFVGAGVLTFGRELAFVLGLLGAFVGVSANFFTTRLIAGQQLTALRSARLKKLLARIDERPILTVAALRSIAFVSPPLNTALALSRVSYRDFALGSALGLVIPMAVVTLVIERLMATPWLARLLFE